ncbi:MAG: hypothetical protein OHK0031_01020 [Anaerolineales bacterium]
MSMKKPMFLLLAFFLAFGGLLQGCGEATTKPDKSIVTEGPTKGPADTPVIPPTWPPVVSPTPSPEGKTLLVLVFDRSASMTSCDPDLKNSKAMAGALLQMLFQYYLPNPFSPAPGNAPDVIVLDYPGVPLNFSTTSAVDSDGMAKRIQDMTISSRSDIFFERMFVDLKNAAISAGKADYRRVVSLVWTDGSFILPEGSNNREAQQKKYREDAQKAFGALPPAVDLGVFFPCNFAQESDLDWWRARQDERNQGLNKRMNILLPLQAAVGESWLRLLPEQHWFSHLFPGLGQDGVAQKLFFYYDEKWHDFSKGGDRLCAGDWQICQFQTSPADTGFAAGMVAVGSTNNFPSLSVDVPVALNDMNTHIWQQKLWPAPQCSQHAWDLQTVLPPSAPVIFWWRGGNDLKNHLEIKNVPSFTFDGAGMRPSPPLVISWGARHQFFATDDPHYILQPSQLQPWLSCYQPALQLGAQTVSLGSIAPQPQAEFLVWSILPEVIDATVNARTFPVPAGQLNSAFWLAYTGPDGIPAAPNDQTSLSFSMPVTYISTLAPGSASCVNNKQAGFGQGASPKPAWSCSFEVVYADPKFHNGKNPMRLWLNYEDTHLCKAQDAQTAVGFAQGFHEDDFSISPGPSSNPIALTYQIASTQNCHPTGLNIDFGDGAWQPSVPFTIVAPSNPLTPLP